VQIERRARESAEAAAHQKVAAQLIGLRKELSKAKREAEARRQQATRLAAYHERSSRTEAKALERAKSLRDKVATLKGEVNALHAHGAPHAHGASHGSAAPPLPPSGPLLHQPPWRPKYGKSLEAAVREAKAREVKYERAKSSLLGAKRFVW